MTYRLDVVPSAQRQLKALDKTVQRRIAEKLEELKANPRSPGVKRLRGPDGLHRARVGNYRVLFQIQDAVLTVLVVEVGHRREVYR